jgi:hypothetical protein
MKHVDGSVDVNSTPFDGPQIELDQGSDRSPGVARRAAGRVRPRDAD